MKGNNFRFKKTDLPSTLSAFCPGHEKKRGQAEEGKLWQDKKKENSFPPKGDPYG